MSDEVIIRLDVDADPALEELTDFSNKVDALGTKWQRLKMTIKKESRQVLYSIQGLVSLVKNVFKAFGMSLGPLGDALLNIIGAVVSSAIAMQYAYAAAGPVGWAMLALSAVALGVAIGAEIKAATGVEEARRAASQANSIIGNIESILGPWR